MTTANWIASTARPLDSLLLLYVGQSLAALYTLHSIAALVFEFCTLLCNSNGIQVLSLFGHTCITFECCRNEARHVLWNLTMGSDK